MKFIRTQGIAEPFWLLGKAGTLSAVWYEKDEVEPRHSVGVLILNGIGPDEGAFSQGVREMGAAAANLGFMVLSVDLAGNGQSPETLDQPSIDVLWMSEITQSIRFLRENGAIWVAVIAPGLGCSLVSHIAQGVHIDAIVFWSPLLSGKRYIRELKLLQATASDPSIVGEGELAIGGYIFPRGVVESIARLDASKVTVSPAPSALYLETAKRGLNESYIEKLRALNAEIDVGSCPDNSDWLATPTDQASPPEKFASEVASWIDSRCPKDKALKERQCEVVARSDFHIFTYRGYKLRETFVSFGPNHLKGVVTEAVEQNKKPISVVFLSMGPGRSFVAAARYLATLGYSSIRFDFSGLGLSPRRPEQVKVNLYDPAARDDVKFATEFMLTQGAGSIVVVGFCAGAWAALSSPPIQKVVGIAAINSYLSVRDFGINRDINVYDWLAPIARFVTKVRGRVSRSKLFAGPAIRWLRGHQKASTTLGLFFDADDYSFKYWDKVIAPKFSAELSKKKIQVKTYKGLGHLANGPAARGLMMKDIEAFIFSCESNVES